VVIITRPNALLLRVMYQFSCFFKWFWGCWENSGRWREFWILMIESRTANRCPIKNCEFKKKAKNKEKREWNKEIHEEKQEFNLIEGIKSLLLLCSWRLKLFFFIRFSLFAIIAILHQCIVHLRRLTSMHIKKSRPGLSRVYSGRPGPGSTRQVDQVFPGQLPGGFLLRPGPVPCPGRPSPSFKIMLSALWWIWRQRNCFAFKNHYEDNVWLRRNIWRMTDDFHMAWGEDM
jgi:hypothetical protein